MQPLANTLRPLTRNPPSTGIALQEPSSQSEPPLDTRVRPSPTTRFSSPSTASGVRRQRHAGRATAWVCMAWASAVEPQ